MYESDVTGWELLWNEKYAGKILMFDNSRDAFGIAQYLLGCDINTTDEAELQACADKLAEQKPVVQQSCFWRTAVRSVQPGRGSISAVISSYTCCGGWA